VRPSPRDADDWAEEYEKELRRARPSADVEALEAAEGSMRVGEVMMGEEDRGVASPDGGAESASSSESDSSSSRDFSGI